MTSSGFVRERSRARVGHSPSTNVLLLSLHPADKLLARGAAGKAVGVGQEAAFRGNLGDFANQIRAGFHALDDLIAGQPLGNGDAVKDRLPFDERIQNVANARVRLDVKFTGLDLVVNAETARCDQKIERPGSRLSLLIIPSCSRRRAIVLTPSPLATTNTVG